MISNTLHHMLLKFLLSLVLIIILVALPLSTVSAACDNEVLAQGRAIRIFFRCIERARRQLLE
jgi:hypothetical protein